MTSMIAPFLRHLDACNNAALPGGRLPFLLGDAQVGWVGPQMTPELERRGVRRQAGRLVLDEPERFQALSDSLVQAGLYRHRAEPFDVRAEPDGLPSYRRCANCAVQLAVRPPSRRPLPAAHRRYRQGTLNAGSDRGHSRWP